MANQQGDARRRRGDRLAGGPPLSCPFFLWLWRPRARVEENPGDGGPYGCSPSAGDAEARPGLPGGRSKTRRPWAALAPGYGLPLASELAARGVRAMTTDSDLDGLAQRFALLTAGPLALLPISRPWRPRCRGDTTADEHSSQILLRGCRSCAGRFTLDDVESVTPRNRDAGMLARSPDCRPIPRRLRRRAYACWPPRRIRRGTNGRGGARSLPPTRPHLTHYATVRRRGRRRNSTRINQVETLERLDVGPGTSSPRSNALTVGDHDAAWRSRPTP